MSQARMQGSSATYLAKAACILTLLTLAMVFNYYEVRGYMPAITSIVVALFFGVGLTKKIGVNRNILNLILPVFLILSYLILIFIAIPESLAPYLLNWIYVVLVVCLAPYMEFAGRSFMPSVLNKIFLLAAFGANILIGLTTTAAYWIVGVEIINPNLISTCIAIQVICLFLIREHVKFSKALLVFSLVALMMSLSRSAWGLAFLGIMIFYTRPQLLWVYKYLIFSLIGMTCSIYYFSVIGVNFFDLIVGNEVLSEIIRFKGDISSDELRFVKYPVVLMESISDQLMFGAGIGSRLYRDLLSEGEDLHSFYLVAISDIGVFGLLIYFLCIFVIYRKSEIRVHCYLLLVLAFSSFSSYLLLGAPSLTMATFLLIASQHKSVKNGPPINSIGVALQV